MFFIVIRAVLLVVFFVVLVPAQILDQVEDTFGVELGPIGTFWDVTTNGSVVVTAEKVRTGSRAFKHQVNVVLFGDTRRAELDNKKFGAYDPDKIYWYGFSLYLPAAEFPATMAQLIQQLRFSNIPWGGYTVPNCRMRKACGIDGAPYDEYNYGGSGHFLTVENGHWIYQAYYQEPGCADCEALDSISFDLGSVRKDVWSDFVYCAKWSASFDGFLKVWLQVNGGGYVVVLDYKGPTWMNYNAARSFARTEGAYNGRVCAPDFTVGLYWNSDNKARYCYSDHIALYEQESATVSGFEKVAVLNTTKAIAHSAAVLNHRDSPFNKTDIRYSLNGKKIVPAGKNRLSKIEHLKTVQSK